MVAPKGIVASGFPSVRSTCIRIGIDFDPWQIGLNRLILAKTADGLYAADTVVISIPRQVGKTFDIGAVVFALCIKTPGMTVVWTAHRFKVARETFTALRSLAKRPELVPHIDPENGIYGAAGNESITFRNGSRIVFAARERGAVRGFSDVDIIVLDEAQILTQSAMADFAPTMNQAANPLMILMGTPPKPVDPGEVFTELRTDALAGVSEDILYVEFSADPRADPGDQSQWGKANPSYPTRTPARSIRRLQKLLSAEDFLREGYGIWDDEAAVNRPINPKAWADTEDPDPEHAPEKISAFAIDVDMDRSFTSIGAAGQRADGKTHLELVEKRRGTGWVVARCVELDEAHGPVQFVIDGGGPGAVLIEDLEAAGITVLVAGAPDVARAASGTVDAVNERTVAHGPQSELDAAITGARKRIWRDGGFAFGRRASEDDITPLNAVSLARWLCDELDYDVLDSVY